MKKKNLSKLIFTIGIFVVVSALLISLIFLRKNEDNWMKNEKGIWIKHGNPKSIPDYVKSQQELISCALNLYAKNKLEGMNFSSQCLGNCNEYAVDIVHNPRSSEDNLKENQCEDYFSGKLSHFIEIDKEGNIIRIV